MSESKGAAPVRDRIELLDALRGFALLGIFVVNMRAFAGWFTLSYAEREVMAGSPDSLVWFTVLVAAVLEGKFYTIFSFLFGLGFALQLSRLQARGLQGIAIYRRRLLILLGFGLIHMSVLWEGDILTLYALLGMLLPFFWRWSDRRLLIAAVVLILLPIPGVALVHELAIKPDLGLPELGNRLFVWLGGDVAQDKTWLLREDLRSYLAWHLSGPPFRIGGFIETWRIPKVLAIMLIGVWAGRRLIEGRLIGDRKFLLRVAVAGAAIGVPANIAYAQIGGLEQDAYSRVFAATVFYAIGVVPLGLAYAASFAWLCHYVRPLVALFAPAGRMALTNYLGQTLAGIILFYGIGFGFYRSINPWVFSAIAVAVFAAQLLLSRLWLSRFEQGPMEALWRRLTYGGRRAGELLPGARRSV